jgi:polygalacturonase
LVIRLFTLSFVFGLVFVASNCFAAEVTPYPRPIGDAPNSEYGVTVNGIEVDTIETVMGVGYAHFGFTGNLEVQIKVNEPVDSVDISPHRLKIKHRVSGNTVTFSVAKPCKLHLRINNLQRFFLFADPIEHDAPQIGDKGVVSLTGLGVVSSSEEIQTEKIQNAINQAVKQDNTLVVPAGIYVAGTLHLPSNLRLYLSPGAIIKGTARLEDYHKGRGEGAQLRMDNARHVQIFGRGVIDNNGFLLRKQFLPDRKRGRTKMLVASRSQDLIVKDVVLRDSGVWCVHTVESDGMRFSNLKIISVVRSETGPDTSHNTDGFDPDNSSNITIENNFISVDDDAIAVKLKGGRRTDMHNIVFRDNVIWNVCSALKIGTEVHDYVIRDVLFENNDIVHTDTGIVIQCYRGGYVDSVSWINNHFEQVGIVPNESPHRKGADIYINTRSRDSFGEIRNLIIKDNTFENVSTLPSMIRANGSKQVVENVMIENLIMAGKHCTSAQDAGIKIDRDVKGVELR